MALKGRLDHTSGTTDELTEVDQETELDLTEDLRKEGNTHAQQQDGHGRYQKRVRKKTVKVKRYKEHREMLRKVLKKR